MKQEYFDYLQKEFGFDENEIKEFSDACFLPLKKSIRVNTNKISIPDFKKLASKNNRILSETGIGKNTFYVDRIQDLDTALGNTVEHQKGLFYIQEISASSSPYYMSCDQIDNGNYLILDMSASPGGKTTQLCEYYPNSIIIANENNKERLPGLYSNLDRMGALNAICTNYDGRFFSHNMEMFDKVLLDAPCSGEGTAYKNENAIKLWNIKNIKSISKLQISLLDSALKTLKVGGELVYSTCTLNKIENEGVVEAVLKRYGNNLEIVKLDGKNHIRRWPHIDKSGGFFVTKILKTGSIQKKQKEIYSRDSFFNVKLEKNKKQEKKIVQTFDKLHSKNVKFLEKFIEENYDFKICHMKFYEYQGEIYLTDKDISSLWDKLFFYRIGVNIGKFKGSEFIPSEFLASLR